jgi:hypothetical protein
MDLKTIRFSIIQFQISLLFYASSTLLAQSFEGTMSGRISEKGKEVNLFIWVDLIMPKGKDSGSVTGSYFYRTIGKEIKLSGIKDISAGITLMEKNKKLVTTGVFSLKPVDGDLQGSWYIPGGGDTLAVHLYRTGPGFRKTAKIPDLRQLLASEIETYASDGQGTVDYWVSFVRCNILCVGLRWENYGYTAHYGTIEHTYDLSTREEINLADQINDECRNYLSKKIQEKVTQEREKYSDSEWVEGIYPNTLERINEIFTVTSLPERASISLGDSNLVCYIEDFCEQNYSSGNRGMSFDVTVTIPFKDLKKFISKESILQNFFVK